MISGSGVRRGANARKILGLFRRLRKLKIRRHISPHGGIKIRTFLTKNNGLDVRIAATLYLGTKGLRAFCQTFDRARALTSSRMALTAAVIMMRPPVNDLRKRSLRVRILVPMLLQLGWCGSRRPSPLSRVKMPWPSNHFGKKRGRANALAISYRTGNLWICSMIERYSSRKSAALDSN